MPKFLHISITVSLNNDTRYRWSDPYTEEEVNFTIPVDLYDATKFGKLIANTLSELEDRFPAKVAEYEAYLEEQKRQELASYGIDTEESED